jgi:anti-anti-sigma factor
VGRAVASGEHGFVLEMSEVTYLDSAGVRLLYHLDERATARQQQLVVVIPTGALINRTLEAAGALGTLRIVASLDDALDVLSA